MERDRRNAELLRAEGWRIETIWECEARRPEALAARLEGIGQGAKKLRSRSASTLPRSHDQEIDPDQAEHECFRNGVWARDQRFTDLPL